MVTQSDLFDYFCLKNARDEFEIARRRLVAQLRLDPRYASGAYTCRLEVRSQVRLSHDKVLAVIGPDALAALPGQNRTDADALLDGSVCRTTSPARRWACTNSIVPARLGEAAPA